MLYTCLYWVKEKVLRILPVDGSYNSGIINLIRQCTCVWKVTYHRVINKKVVILVYSVKSYW